MKRALTQAFTNLDESIVCEFHVTTKNNYLHMKLKKQLLLFVGCLIISGSTVVAQTKKDYHTWATTPPMGWNSWDCFGTQITESQAKEQADYMSANLKKHGWEYFVVDIQWYEQNSKGYDYAKDAVLTMDEFS